MRFRKKNTKVFGVPVEEAAKKSIVGNGIPLVLTRCVDTIEREALTMEGVYRRTGDLSDVDKLMKMYDLGKDPDLPPYDPFVLTSLLKKYFTLLPEPITTYELYTNFIAAKKLKERPDKVKGIRELVIKLPEVNRFILYFLLQHLVRVSKYSVENKMSTTNLSIVFGPTLFRSTDNSSTRLLADAGHLGGCVEIMITNFDRVFDFMLPNVQISVKDDEEIIKLMGDSRRKPSISSASPAAQKQDEKSTPHEGVIELKRDQKRIMSTRIGLNFVEISQQFAQNGTDNKTAQKGMQFEIKKPSEMISIPLPTPNRVGSPSYQDDDSKKTKYARTRRFTVAKQPTVAIAEDDKLITTKNNDEEELILLKQKRHSSLTFNTTIEEDVNNILSDVVNMALLEQTTTITMNVKPVLNWDDFGQWKRNSYEHPVNETLVHTSQPKESKPTTEISDLDIRNMRAPPSFFEEGFPELDEETFQKELNLIEIDLDKPLMGVTARINVIKKRYDILTDNDEDSVPNLSAKELEAERVLLKRELVRFDRLWERERKRTIDRLAKLPLKPLYDRYRRICDLQQSQQDAKTPVSPSKFLHFSAPEKFISPKSPLFNARRAESVKVGRMSNGESTPRVDIRSPSYVARKTTFQLVSPMSPDTIPDERTSERIKLIGQHLANREEYVTTKTQKTELKRKLHQFQDEFIRKNGRKISNKRDKKPVEKEYDEYKRLKRWMKEKEREVEQEVDKILSGTSV